MDRIIIFGTGLFYKNRKWFLGKLLEQDKIVAFIDNNENLTGAQIEGIPIYLPSYVNELQFDYVLLMSINAAEMRKQLLQLNISEDKIYSYEDYCCQVKGNILLEYTGGQFSLYEKSKWRYTGGNSDNQGKRKKYLIISTSLNYNGGTMAAVYACQALYNHGHEVVLAAPDGNDTFIAEMGKRGVEIILVPSMPAYNEMDSMFLSQFDRIMVNVVQMIEYACELSKHNPVVWWIHEPEMLYNIVLNKYPQYRDISSFKSIKIYSVSDLAKYNFESYMRVRVNGVLPLGIPDEKQETNQKRSDKIVFAMIADFLPLKAQDILLKAVAGMKKRDKFEVWLIGNITETEYAKDIVREAETMPNVKIFGRLNHDEIVKIYNLIDVVICASLEETMSIAIAEGMMHGKICITTDNTGIASYITDELNGLICKTGDAESLAKKISWVIERYPYLNKMKEQARKTYEEQFAFDVFEKRLESAFEDLMNKP